MGALTMAVFSAGVAMGIWLISHGIRGNPILPDVRDRLPDAVTVNLTLAWLLGVHPEETRSVGSLLGIKMSLNEFIAYDGLARSKDELSPRSVMLSTYALCGFANFSSIAIQIGGISALENGLRPTLAKYGLRAMIGGTLAAMTTACVVGVLS